MNLPQRIKRHQYEFKLSNNKVIKYTPWLVRDEQEYMYATEGVDDKEYKIPHIEELLKKCVDEDIDFDTFSDLDFLRFAIDVRKVSKGSVHEVTFTCPNCGVVNEPTPIDLDKDVFLRKFNKEPINISNMTFHLREVTRGEIEEMKTIQTDSQKRFRYVVHSIQSISVDDKIYSNLSTDEIQKFLGEELESEEYFELSTTVIGLSPSIAIEKKIYCQKCGLETLVYVNNLSDFFE